jgi:hypothetical protein
MYSYPFWRESAGGSAAADLFVCTLTKYCAAVRLSPPWRDKRRGLGEGCQPYRISPGGHRRDAGVSISWEPARKGLPLKAVECLIAPQGVIRGRLASTGRGQGLPYLPNLHAARAWLRFGGPESPGGSVAALGGADKVSDSFVPPRAGYRKSQW